MARFRLSPLARADLAQILATSVERWGIEGKRRYAAVLAAAMRKVAAEPEGPTTRGRGELSRGIRSFHLRNARAGHAEAKVRTPVHVLYYRAIRPGLVEIVRVLHERMEPSRHIGADLKKAPPL
jgi:toxin ParE1/3/4